MATDPAAVVIAYRDMGCPHRRAAFEHVHRWYQAAGWPIHVWGGHDDATFGRAAAINHLVAVADAAVIVQADPDSLVPPARLHDAVALAARARGLVVPHTRYLYAGRPVTADILAGDRDPLTVTPAECDSHGPEGSGNVVVFSAITWRMAGRYDERFGLWGGDDAAFAYATEAFCGPVRRLDGDMVHLWHPRLPQSQPGHPGYVAQFALLAEYRDAARVGAHMVRRLVHTRARVVR
jgi:hypothetical protein